MKRVLFLLLFATILFGCGDGINEKMTGYKFTVSDIADLDKEIDQVIITLSYKEAYPMTEWETFKTIPIASSSIQNKEFTVYLPEHLPAKYLNEGVGDFHTDNRELTISNPNVRITRSISFKGYSKGVFKGFFICDNYTNTQPLVEKGYHEIGLAYSNAPSTITGTQSSSTGGKDELRYTFDLNMNAGYNLYMGTTVERDSDGGLHHLLYTAPVNVKDEGTKWRFLRFSE